MLVLTRRVGETILIGDDIEVKVSLIDGRNGYVRLTFIAPDDVAIVRKEIARRVGGKVLREGRRQPDY